jgi:hypothetical protein
MCKDNQIQPLTIEAITPEATTQIPQENTKSQMVGPDALIIFLTSAIMDIQGIIRAVDTKLQVFIGFLLLPILIVGKVLTYFDHLVTMSSWPGGTFWAYALIAFFVASWLVALLIFFAGLNSIGNPVNHTRNDTKAKGCFYLGYLFSPKYYHSIVSCNLMAKKKSSAVIAELPANGDLVIHELVFEHIKVVFIRDLKIFRQKVALKLMLVSSFLGVLIVTLVHYGK